MAFTVEEFEDLYRLLSEHPDWRARLRPLILGDEFLQVPGRLAAIDERLDRVSETLDRMAARQDQMDQRLDRVSETLDRMAARQDQMDQRLFRVEGTLGRHDGYFLELKYGQQFGSWFGKYVRGARQVGIDELEGVTQALLDGKISQTEVDRLYDLDFIVGGRSKETQDEVLLAVEVSTTVRTEDVSRAEQRAETLRRAGYRSAAFVGGVSIEDRARERAAEVGAIVDLHPSFSA